MPAILSRLVLATLICTLTTPLFAQALDSKVVIVTSFSSPPADCRSWVARWPASSRPTALPQ